MPALEACCRVWEFGSDDLFFPVLASVIIRGVWFAGMLGGTLYYRDALGCEQIHYLSGFASVLLSITLIGILVEIAIMVFSARGSIVHVKPRWPVVYLLYVRTVILFLEVVLLVIGTGFAYKWQQEVDSDCPDLKMAVTMMHVVVGAYWFVFIVFLVVAVIYLDPCHCYSARVNYSQVTTRITEGNVDQDVVQTHWNLVHTVWEKRFKVACCLAGDNEVHQLAYREVAEIFAHLFCDTNVVMSDIVAGFILLQKEQIALEKTERKNRKKNLDVMDVEGQQQEEEPVLSFDFHIQDDRELFRDLQHFIKYALAMYSWPFYIYMNPLCGLCHLCTRLNCCRRRNGVPHIHKDNRCSCHLGGLQQIAGLDELDILYASFENDVYKVPYTICLDHETKSVVMAFRGTFSFGDVVTDLTASTKPIQLPGYPDFLVHKGMLKTVSAILEKLDEEQILEDAFDKVPGYKLVVVGHSLGSGCACIFSMLLKERYPDLRCFCYSPTGALLNEAAAEFTEEFVTSLVLGQDVISRLNVPNTHKLKEDLVRVIESCRKPKCRILSEGVLETLLTCFGGLVVFGGGASEISPGGDPSERGNSDYATTDDDDTDPLLVAGDHQETTSPTVVVVHGTTNTTNSPATNENGSRNRNTEITPILRPSLSSLTLPVRGAAPSPNSSPVNSLSLEVERRLVPLFPPGKIIHIMDTSESRRCFCASRQLEVRWASRHDFNRIRVSPDMIRDHFPDVLYRAVNDIWNSKLQDLEDSDVRHHYT